VPVVKPTDKIYMAGPWITDHEIQVVEDCMRNGWYSYQYVERFQTDFARYHGRRFGIMTPNCTTAIHLLLTSLGIAEGDEVIVPECTWIATSAPVSYLRATPVFCDIDAKNWCLDPVSVERSITERTRAIIAVDLFGNMPYMDELVEISKRFGISLIEDSAEALGSSYKGRRAGSFGVGSVFSFHRTKTITTGEGGMLLLDDEKLYERCMFLRDHGRGPGTLPYYNDEIAYKYMPCNLLAAMGFAQFQRIDELVGRKREQLGWYRKHLSDLDDVELNPEPEGGVNGAWITTMVLGKSHGMDKLTAMQKLEAIGVPSRPFFYPLSSIPAYAGLREKYEPLNPVSYDVSARGISLPGAATVTEEQVERVCQGIKMILGRTPSSAALGGGR
jgi:perosamine synthetase